MTTPPVEKTSTDFKSGYAGIIGKPNVGKSTLLNRLVASKIAAISRRPQTTRNRILGVCHLPGGQIILLDTPGIHKATKELNQQMVKTSLSTFSDVDLILFMIDARGRFSPDDQYVLDSMARARVPKILIINKIDLVPKPELLTLIDEVGRKSEFTDIVPISALKSDGLEILTGVILDHLPKGPRYFPEDMVTDCPEEFLIGEIIREKIIRLTRLELPYSVAVVVESIREGENGVLLIDATLYTEKVSQRKILIGEKGSMLKKVGSQAREEIEKRFGGKVYLNLFVKVKTHWRDNRRCIREFVFPHD